MPDRLRSYYPWIILGQTLINQAFTVGIAIYSFALFVVPWLERFDISRSEVMLATVLLQITGGFISPIFGRLLDSYSIRLLVSSGGLAMGAGLLLLAASNAFWQINLVFATLLPLGMVLAGTLSSQTLIARWFHKNHSMAIGVSSMGTSIGGFLFPPVTAALIAAFGWQQTLTMLGLATLVFLLPLNLLVLQVSPPAPPAARGRSVTGSAGGLISNQEILSRASFWLPVLGLIPINAAFGGVQFNLGAYVADLGFDQQTAAQLISITALSMIFGKLMFGWAGDRYDHRHIYWVMAALLMSSLLLYQGRPDRTELMLAAVLQGVATGGVLPMIAIMYAARFGTLAFGRVLGLVYLFLVAGSFGSLLSGWLFDVSGSYDLAFQIFAGLLLPAAFGMFWLASPEVPGDLDPTPVGPDRTEG